MAADRLAVSVSNVPIIATMHLKTSAGTPSELKFLPPHHVLRASPQVHQRKTRIVPQEAIIIGQRAEMKMLDQRYPCHLKFTLFLCLLLPPPLHHPPHQV